MLALAALLEEVGLPDRASSTSSPPPHSGGVCEPLIRDPRLRKLTFTGSTAVGKVLVEQSAEQLLRVSMELGGNAPFLVFDDADLDAAVDGAMLAKMRNIGEACTAANRFLVHESVADEFAARLAERMGALTVGRRHRGRGRRRPAHHRARPATASHELVDDAVAGGATRAHRRRASRRARATSTRPRCSPTCRPTARVLARGDLRPGRARSRRSPTRTRRVQRPTTPSTAWSPTSSPATSPACSASARRWSSAWSGINHGHRLQPGRPVRRRQALRLRPRGRLRGHRGVPRDQVRRQRAVTAAVTTIDRRSPALHAEEEQRFVDLHPTSARLAAEPASTCSPACRCRG